MDIMDSNLPKDSSQKEEEEAGCNQSLIYTRPFPPLSSNFFCLLLFKSVAKKYIYSLAEKKMDWHLNPPLLLHPTCPPSCPSKLSLCKYQQMLGMLVMFFNTKFQTIACYISPRSVLVNLIYRVTVRPRKHLLPQLGTGNINNVHFLVF